jgi:hypothetical protein
VIFPGRWIGRGNSIAWPPLSPDLRSLEFLLWGYLKDQLYSQRANTLDELKARITASTLNVQKTCYSASGTKWSMGGMYENAELQTTFTVN